MGGHVPHLYRGHGAETACVTHRQGGGRVLAVHGGRPGGVLVSAMFLLQSGDGGRGLPADLKT